MDHFVAFGRDRRGERVLARPGADHQDLCRSRHLEVKPYAGHASPSKAASAYSLTVVDALAPVSVRVTRPYASEDELLENELEAFTRTSITLLGAQPRPPGLVLRFELLLSSGQVIMRGEGRVVGYKRDVYYGLGGLTLRFTRLDSRSKALVDKAAAIRERRRPSSKAPTLESPPSPSRPDRLEVAPPEPAPGLGPPVVPVGLPVGLPVELPVGLPEAPVIPAAPVSEPELELTFTPLSQGVLPAPASTPTGRPIPARRPVHPLAAPSNRDALLARLRDRSRALGTETIRRILEPRRSG